MRYLKLFAVLSVAFLSIGLTGCSDDDNGTTGEGNAVVSFDTTEMNVLVSPSVDQNVSIPLILQEGTSPLSYPIRIKVDAVGIDGIDPFDYIFFTPIDQTVFIEEFNSAVDNSPFLDLMISHEADLTKPRQVVISMVAIQGATAGAISSVTLNLSRSY